MSIASDVLLKETVARVEALEQELLELKANLLPQKPLGIENDTREVRSVRKYERRQ